MSVDYDWLDRRPLPEILDIDHEPTIEELSTWLAEHCDEGAELIIDRSGVTESGWSVVYEHAGATFWEDSVEDAVRHIAKRWVRYGSHRYPYTGR